MYVQRPASGGLGALGAIPPYVDPCTGVEYPAMEARAADGSRVVFPEFLTRWGGSGVNGQPMSLQKLLDGDFRGFGSMLGDDGVEYWGIGGWQWDQGPCAWNVSSRAVLDLLQQLGVAGPNQEVLGNTPTTAGYIIVDAETGERREATPEDILPPPPEEPIPVEETAPEDRYEGQGEAYDEGGRYVGPPPPEGPGGNGGPPPPAPPPIVVTEPPPIVTSPEAGPEILEAGAVSFEPSILGWAVLAGLGLALLRGSKGRRGR